MSATIAEDGPLAARLDGGPAARVADTESPAASSICFHCGTACRGPVFRRAGRSFCCQGCLTVFDLLTETGLTDFYAMSPAAGLRVNGPGFVERFRFLDEPSVRERLVDYADDRTTRVTFRLPGIHCIACVWLLENLFRLRPGIGATQVHFPRKEVSISFETARLKLSEVASLLTSLGYEPEFNLADLEDRRRRPAGRRLWLQLGVAGFAFGNIMLLSVSTYLGLDPFGAETFKPLFGWLSMALAVPVLGYSALDYWRAAWLSLRQRALTIDVPIAAGLVALAGQSAFEVVSGRGEGYFDSLAGLLFFLLCGRLFQQKTYDRLSFDRDYKSFFPLSVSRLPNTGPGEERVSLAGLVMGDRLLIRNGELLPADARLVEGPALIDYSFVTGESDPVRKVVGDHLYAGGRQVGGAIKVETVKEVSQGYLTSLWNQESFRKARGQSLDTLTNRYSRRFTRIVIGIALGAAAFWAVAEPARSLKSFTAVLIVACPCALALAAPFALGTAQRLLGRRRLFLRNPGVIETLARVDAVVFDKTGTLTRTGAVGVKWHGAKPLSREEEHWLHSIAQHSTHPLAVRVGEVLAHDRPPETVRAFQETAGCGIAGTVAGHDIRMGSAAWMQSLGVAGTAQGTMESVVGSVVHVAIDGDYRGCFVLAGALRPETRQLIDGLSGHCELALLSGDRDRERHRFNELFGAHRPLLFQQSPHDKLEFIRQWQRAGRTVMMVGDGLNDAGALQQSDVGVAVVERLHAFSPACDVIAAGDMLPHLDRLLKFARSCVRVVQSSFVISSLYNVIGISIAASGHLSPLVCAVLMPISSITVVGFACGATTWLARRHLPGIGTDADATAAAASATVAAGSQPDSHPTEATP